MSALRQLRGLAVLRKFSVFLSCILLVSFITLYIELFYASSKANIVPRQISQLSNNPQIQLKQQIDQINRVEEMHTKYKKYQTLYRFERVNCAKVISGDSQHIEEALKIRDEMKNDYEAHELLPQFYQQATKDCPNFFNSRGYINDSLPEEEAFPLAFSILAFKDIEMFERLLRMIYRPQNAICVHIDAKSDGEYFKAVEGIVRCLPNVFLTPRRVDIQWGEFSVLEPDVMCMQELWRYKKWKYFINLTGQEFPLKTNFELVKILSAYNGANDLEGTVKRRNMDRFLQMPPHDITPVKGSVHIAVNRDFVDYILHNNIAQDLLEWARNIEVPDESFFTSINHNPQLGVRGSYKGEPETDTTNRKPFLTRFKNWGNGNFNWPCAGNRRVRLICILSTGDLPLMATRPEMFANKFYLNDDRVVVGCLEEMIYNRTLSQFSTRRFFNTSFYENLGFVKDSIR